MRELSILLPHWSLWNFLVLGGYFGISRGTAAYIIYFDVPNWEKMTCKTSNWRFEAARNNDVE